MTVVAGSSFGVIIYLKKSCRTHVQQYAPQYAYTEYTYSRTFLYFYKASIQTVGSIRVLYGYTENLTNK